MYGLKVGTYQSLDTKVSVVYHSEVFEASSDWIHIQTQWNCWLTHHQDISITVYHHQLDHMSKFKLLSCAESCDLIPTLLLLDQRQAFTSVLTRLLASRLWNRKQSCQTTDSVWAQGSYTFHFWSSNVGKWMVLTYKRDILPFYKKLIHFTGVL